MLVQDSQSPETNHCQHYRLVLNQTGAVKVKTTFGSNSRKPVCLCPPRRNNLVVAVLEASPAWYDMHTNIRSITKTKRFDTTTRGSAIKQRRWTTHVTFANVATPRNKGSSVREQAKVMEQLRRNIPQPQKHLAYPQGIAIWGGEDLDWLGLSIRSIPRNFAFS